jgi:hypothetical protein
MIGVACKSEEVSVVAEFFQLFKTPWELLEEGNSYDVVLATGDTIPQTDARLLLVFSSEPTSQDRVIDVVCKTGNQPAAEGGRKISTPDGVIPLYGKALIFQRADQSRVCCNSEAGPIALAIERGEQTIIRVGFDLFAEVRYLLTQGQPVKNAPIPTLDVHIQQLRRWMIEKGLTFVEIPPVPYGYEFAGCLTHDIDFVGITRHKFDHTSGGFLYRSVIRSFGDFVTGRISFARLAKIWKAVISLPFVHLGLAKDFWMPFEWYLEVEKGLNPTYFLIPLKGVAGRKVNAKNPARRASPYEPGEIKDSIKKLLQENCEIGVHGIDAWHDVESGRAELKKIQAETGARELGIRIHWLLRDENTHKVLEAAGFSYDATFGYNEAVGYRAGTGQVFRPLDVKKLVQLPLHIQDGALFYPNRLGLSEAAAMELCEGMIKNAAQFGGVLTLLWHDRSHGPERFWGDFYRALVARLKSRTVWFATGMSIVRWFSSRRDIKFVRESARDTAVRLEGGGERIDPPLTLRHYNKSSAINKRDGFTDLPWTGTDISQLPAVKEIRKSAVPENALA